MSHTLRALALVAMFTSSTALARAPMETNQLVDDKGAPVGVSGSPLTTADVAGATTLFVDATNAVVAANSTTGPVPRSVPASPTSLTRYNATFRADYAGTGIIQGSNDGFATQAVTVDMVSLAGGQMAVTRTVPLTFGAYRVYYQNTSGNQGLVTITSSFTAN